MIKRLIERYTTQIAVFVCLIFGCQSLPAQPSNAGKSPLDLMDRFDSLERADDKEIDRLLEEIRICIANELFAGCANEKRNQVYKLVITEEQKRRVEVVTDELTAARREMHARRHREEEAARRAQQRARNAAEDAESRERRTRIAAAEARQRAADNQAANARQAEIFRQQRQALIDHQEKVTADRAARNERQRIADQEHQNRWAQNTTSAPIGTPSTNNSDRRAAEQARESERQRVEAQRQAEAARAQAERDERAQREREERERQTRLAQERAEQEQLQRIERERIEIASRAERDSALQQLRANTRLSARTCPGQDVRIVGIVPSDLKAKAGGCINVSYVAQCPGESGGSGIRGTMRSFVGAATDCYLGDAVALSSAPSCKADAIRVSVTDVQPCR